MQLPSHEHIVVATNQLRQTLAGLEAEGRVVIDVRFAPTPFNTIIVRGESGHGGQPLRA